MANWIINRGPVCSTTYETPMKRPGQEGEAERATQSPYRSVRMKIG